MPKPAATLFAAAIALAVGINVAHAAMSPEVCFAKKRLAHGKLENCLGVEVAKALQGKPNDIAKCSTKLAEQLAKLNEQAIDAGIACRYRDNGGTVTDFDTALEWEKKGAANGVQDFANPHDPDNVYTWSASGPFKTGTAFTEFLGRLNTCSSAPGFIPTFGFAGHCDWRLPTLGELQGITFPCTGGPCIDPVFGPVGILGGVSSPYWTATGSAADASQAWRVQFNDGSSLINPKVNAGFLRAVRHAF